MRVLQLGGRWRGRAGAAAGQRTSRPVLVVTRTPEVSGPRAARAAPRRASAEPLAYIGAVAGGDAALDAAASALESLQVQLQQQLLLQMQYQLQLQLQ